MTQQSSEYGDLEASRKAMIRAAQRAAEIARQHSLWFSKNRLGLNRVAYAEAIPLIPQSAR